MATEQREALVRFNQRWWSNEAVKSRVISNEISKNNRCTGVYI
jgi:hypothetical protein